MKIDIEKVREQIKKLQEVERIASDPEMMALLEKVMVNNGSSPQEGSRSFANEPPQPLPEGLYRASVSGRIIGKRKKGDVLNAVREAALRRVGPFDGYSLAKTMQSDGFIFDSKTPSITVIDALRTLVKNGELKVRLPGRRGKPTLFTKEEPS